MNITKKDRELKQDVGKGRVLDRDLFTKITKNTMKNHTKDAGLDGETKNEEGLTIDARSIEEKLVKIEVSTK